MKKIVMIASGGGHWVQLQRIVPALEGHSLVFVTVDPAYQVDVKRYPFYVVRDATRWNKFRLVVLILQIARILFRERPDVIVTTGAAPGYFALRLGKYFGARTIWIDSIANVQRLSMSGQRVRRYADLWLTQWEHLSRPEGPDYFGAVL